MHVLPGLALPRARPGRTAHGSAHASARSHVVTTAQSRGAGRRHPHLACNVASSAPQSSSDTDGEQPGGIVATERRINEAVVSSTVRLPRGFIPCMREPTLTLSAAARCSCSTRCMQTDHTRVSMCWRPSHACPTSVRLWLTQRRGPKSNRQEQNLGGQLNCARACACLLRAHQASYLSCTSTRRWAGGVAATT
jgi:hypothetical protein